MTGTSLGSVPDYMQGGGGPSYVDFQAGWNPIGVLGLSLDGERISVAGVIWAVQGKNAIVAVDIYNLMEWTSDGAVVLENFYNATDNIENGAPVGPEITGATINTAWTLGIGYSASALVAAFLGGEAAEPFAGGVLSVGGMFAYQAFGPSNQAVGNAVLDFPMMQWPVL